MPIENEEIRRLRLQKSRELDPVKKEQLGRQILELQSPQRRAKNLEALSNLMTRAASEAEVSPTQERD